MKKNYFLMVLIALFATATLSFADQTVALRVQVPAATNVVYATGPFNSWSTYATPMTKVQDSPKIFEAEITVPDNVGGDYQYKFLAGPSWDYQQSNPSGDFTYGTDGWDGAVVNSFAQYLTPVNIQVNVKVPKTTHYCYITGNFVNWEEPKKEMTFVDEVADGKNYTYTVLNFDPSVLEFKFASGPKWKYEQTQSANFSYSGNGGANNEVSVVCTGFKDIYELGNITVNIISYPSGTDSIYLVGNFFGPDWDINEAIPAVKNADGSFTAVIYNVADVEYKCWNRKDWAYEECQADGSNLPNRKAKFRDASTVNITVARWKKSDIPTGIEDVKFDYPIIIIDNKIIVSGVQSLVNVYNMNGQVIQYFKGKGDFTSRVLPSGAYILQVDKSQVKVIVE